MSRRDNVVKFMHMLDHFDIVWQIVWGDRPPLIASLEQIIRGFEGRPS